MTIECFLGCAESAILIFDDWRERRGRKVGKEREEGEQGKGEGCGVEGTWKGLVNVNTYGRASRSDGTVERL